ncbi:MAG: hypothetical protein AB9907_04815 [Flexilinea sp.]
MKRYLVIVLSLFLTGCAIARPSQNELVSKAVGETLYAMTAVGENETIPINPVTDTAEPAIPTLLKNTPPQIEIANMSGTSIPQTATPTTVISIIPKVDDQFSKNAQGFGIGDTFEDETMLMKMSDGILNITPKMKDGWRNWRLRPPEISNGTTEVEFRFNSCKGSDKFGIVVRAPNYSDGSGYYCSVTCEGNAQIQRDSTTLSSAIIPRELYRPDGINKLSVSVIENKINLYLNDEKITGAEDNFYKKGFSGFFTAPTFQNTLSVGLDRFKIFY